MNQSQNDKNYFKKDGTLKKTYIKLFEQLDIIDKDEFIAYYNDYNYREISEHFNISEALVQQIVDYYQLFRTLEQRIRIKHESTIRCCMKRYGCKNGGGSEVAQSKIRQTMINHYGSHIFSYKPFVESNLQHQKDTYGGIGWSSQILNDKFKHTMMQKYGAPTPMKSSIIKQRLNDNMIKKYGVNCYAKLNEFHVKSRNVYSYNDVKFDSSWELAVYIYAIDHNEQIQRCPKTFQFELDNNVYTYTPDFLYNGQLVEIKGDQFFKNGTLCNPYSNDQKSSQIFAAKYECGLQHNVVYWTQKDVKFALNYCKQKFSNKNWYKQFKVKHYKETLNEK